jgi:spoIIIJ-associated protein
VAEPTVVEASGETVGEAKWLAVRELEKHHPGLDRTRVEFEVIAEGDRGLLGVGTTPARVLARYAPEPTAEQPGPATRSTVGALAGEVLARIVEGVGARCGVHVEEDDDGTVLATIGGADAGLLIGRGGQTIDAIQHLVLAITHRVDPEADVIVDAADYRERRRSRLEALAVRTARQVESSGSEVALEPMPPAERKIVHVRLQDTPGIATRSEGDEPNRYVVVVPAGG